MEEIIKNQLNKKYKTTVKIQYDNGANETIYPIGSLNVNPLIPMMLELLVKKGMIRSVNLTKIRTMDTIIEEEIDLSI